MTFQKKPCLHAESRRHTFTTHATGYSAVKIIIRNNDNGLFVKNIKNIKKTEKIIHIIDFAFLPVISGPFPREREMARGAGPGRAGISD